MGGSGAPPARRMWWIPAIRGAFAVTLGGIAIATGSHRAALVNFLGIYWLISAALTVAWAARTRWKRGSRLGLMAGMIGLVAGLLVLFRHVLEPIMSVGFLLDALGISAILTGTLRLAGAFEVERRTGLPGRAGSGYGPDAPIRPDGRASSGIQLPSVQATGPRP